MISSVTPQEDKLPIQDEQTEDKNRRVKDRRQKSSEGYMYLSIVGWICRRDKRRRNPRQSR